MPLITRCICGSKIFRVLEGFLLPMRECMECGVIHQHVEMNSDGLMEWYKKYIDNQYTHNYEQDVDVALKRITSYGQYIKPPVLDVGCGNSAFVNSCNKRKIRAFGQDIAWNAADFNMPLNEVRGTFNTITMYDVLEHVENPQEFLIQVGQLLSDIGTLIIEFPAFFNKSGQHHWKKIEHLWMLNKSQLRKLLSDCEFSIYKEEIPIEGKVVFICKQRGGSIATRKCENRDMNNAKRILVPPGIGDIYWVLVKLRAFCREQGIEKPEVWIDAPDDKKRSLQFIQRVPFIRAGGYFDKTVDKLPQKSMANWKGRMARREAYSRDGQHVFPDIDGFDWFISFNGSMDFGKSLYEIEPQWPVEWDIDFSISEREKAYGESLKSDIGEYVIGAFFDHGHYKKWISALPAEKIYAILSDISDRLGVKIVLTGASWDDSPINRDLVELDRNNGRVISLVGKTMLEEFFGALRSAKGCIGFPAGNTIMSVAFGIPTVIIWNDHYHRNMWTNSCPPNKRYEAVDCLDENIAGKLIQLSQ